MSEIKQINSYEFDERFYQKIVGDKVEYAPSVTHVLGCSYPSDWGLTHWRGDVGNKRADEIVDEASEDGSYVHDAIERILKGEKVEAKEIEERFKSKRCLKVKRCLKAFLDWHAEFKPKTLQTEFITWGKGFAGTVDFTCMIGEEKFLIDWKSSKSISVKHKVQVTTYAESVGGIDKVAILQLGNTTKKKYTFTVLKDEDRTKYKEQWDITLKMFQTLNPNAKPSEETFPEVFNL